MKNRVSLEYIGHRLREIRKEQGLSQQDVAEALGIPQSNLSRIENGKQRLNLSVLAGILSTYGMEMDDFFSFSGGQSPARPLDTGEQKLLSLYRLLDTEGKQDVLEFLEFKVARTPDGDEEAWPRG